MSRVTDSTVHLLSTDDVLNTTVTSSTDVDPPAIKLIPTGVLIVIVLAAACIVLGAVYGYVYFTRVDTRTSRNDKKPARKPSSVARADSHGHQGDVGLNRDDGSNADRGGAGTTPLYTHMFLFRKHHHNPC